MISTLIEKIDTYLTGKGFLKRNKTRWVLVSKYYFFLIEIQKSRFSDTFYLNHGFYFKSIGKSKFDFTSQSLHLCSQYAPFLNTEMGNDDDYTINDVDKTIIKSIEELIICNLDNVNKAEKFFLDKIKCFKIYTPRNEKSSIIIECIKEIGSIYNNNNVYR